MHRSVLAVLLVCSVLFILFFIYGAVNAENNGAEWQMLPAEPLYSGGPLDLRFAALIVFACITAAMPTFGWFDR